MEEEAKKAQKECRACEMSRPFECPLCTKEGLILIVIAIILAAVNNQYTRYISWAVLLAAFLVPLGRQLVKNP